MSEVYHFLKNGLILKNGVPLRFVEAEEQKKFEQKSSPWICEKCLGLSYDLIGFEEKTPGYLRPLCWCCGEKPIDDKERMHYITPKMLLGGINHFCRRYLKEIEQMTGRESCRDVT